MWPPGGLEQHFNASNCNVFVINWHGVHEPARYPDDARLPARVVGVFRKPHDRLRSCWTFVEDFLRPSCLKRRAYGDVLQALLYTHGLPVTEYVAHFERHNCSTPVGWLTSRQMWPVISGIQTKSVVGLPLSYNFSSPTQQVLQLLPPSTLRLWQQNRSTFRSYFPGFPTAPSFWAMTVAKLRIHSNFAFVGLTEQFDASVCLFHALFMGGAPVAEVEKGRSHSQSPVAAERQEQRHEPLNLPVDGYDDQLYQHVVAPRFKYDLDGAPLCKMLLKGAESAKPHHRS